MRRAAVGHARDPVMVQFDGAPPMALLTVGAGALLLGPGLIGAHVEGQEAVAVSGLAAQLVR
jgi:hypothetical protein